MERKHALLIAGGLAVLAFVVVIVVLGGARRTVPVVAAAHFLPSGTVLTDKDVEVIQVAESSAPAVYYASTADVTGKTLLLPRAPGDLIVPTVFESLSVPVVDPDKRLVFLNLKPDAAGTGVIQPGMYVDVVLAFDPQAAAAAMRSSSPSAAASSSQPQPTPPPNPYAAAPAPAPTPNPYRAAARVVVTNLRVAFVSSEFRMAATQSQAIQEEGGSGSQLAPVRASSSSGLVGLEVPADSVELSAYSGRAGFTLTTYPDGSVSYSRSAGYSVSVPALLVLAAQEGTLHLVLRPADAQDPQAQTAVVFDDLLKYVAGWVATSEITPATELLPVIPVLQPTPVPTSLPTPAPTISSTIKESN